METFLLYKHFQRSPQVPSTRQELADFWLGFLLEACQPFVAAPRCPVRGPTEPGVAVPGDHPALRAHRGFGEAPNSPLVPTQVGGWGCRDAGWGPGGWGGSPCSPPLPQVLVLELGKVLRPARLALHGGTEEPALTLALVCPMEEVGMGLGGGLGGCPPTPSSPAPSAESAVELDLCGHGHPGCQVSVSPVPLPAGPKLPPVCPQPLCLPRGQHQPQR